MVITLIAVLSQITEVIALNSQLSLMHAEHTAGLFVATCYGWYMISQSSTIILQVLLSQVHRLRALDLLGRFLDLGPWAVSLVRK